MHFAHGGWPDEQADAEMAMCAYTWAMIIDRLAAQAARGERAPYFKAGAPLPARRPDRGSRWRSERRMRLFQRRSRALRPRRAAAAETADLRRPPRSRHPGPPRKLNDGDRLAVAAGCRDRAAAKATAPPRPSSPAWIRASSATSSTWRCADPQPAAPRGGLCEKQLPFVTPGLTLRFAGAKDGGDEFTYERTPTSR